MSNNALILLWKGQNLPDNLIKKIAEVLLTNQVCIPEMLTIKYKDEESVANALIRDCNTTATIITPENGVSEAVKQAVIYIGTRFEKTLNVPNGDLTAFTIELSLAFRDEKGVISFEDANPTRELYNAVEIIATEKAVIPRTLARKYHFTQKVCDIIKKIYNAY